MGEDQRHSTREAPNQCDRTGEYSCGSEGKVGGSQGHNDGSQTSPEASDESGSQGETFSVSSSAMGQSEEGREDETLIVSFSEGAILSGEGVAPLSFRSSAYGPLGSLLDASEFFTKEGHGGLEEL